MRFCVTGTTGLLGNNLCRLLVKQGHQVVAPIRPSSSRRPLEGLPLEIIDGSLESRDFIEEVLENVDGVFHAAAVIWLGRTKLEESVRINVGVTQLIAEQCVARNIRMVHVSSTDALAAGTRDRPADENDVEPAKCESNYVVSKRMAEATLLSMHDKQDLDVVIVNPGLLLGPYDWKPSSGRMILAVTDGYLPLAPLGGISVADVRQVAKAMVAAFHRGRSGQRYILAGENIRYLALWRRMARLAGRKGPLSYIGGPYARAVGWVIDGWARIAGESEVNSLALQLGLKYNYYDSSRAIEELGYEPGNLDDSLNAHWEWLLENGMTRHSKKKTARVPTNRS